MNNVIAKIRLNSGQGGFWDPISRIHLTAGNPERDITAGTNCTGLRAAVRSKRIRLVSGSLGSETPPFKLIKKNGKVALVPNIPVQTVEKVDKPKKQVKKKEVSAVQDPKVLVQPTEESETVQETVQESIVKQEPIIEQESVEQSIVQEEIAPQETFAEAVSDETVKEISEGLDQLEEQLDQAEQEQFDQSKKKKKKKK